MNLAFYRMPGIATRDDAVSLLAQALAARDHVVTVYDDGKDLDPLLISAASPSSKLRWRNRSQAQAGHDVTIAVDFPPAISLQLGVRQWLWLTAPQGFDPTTYEWVIVPNDFALRSLSGKHPVLSGKVIALTDEGVAFWDRLLAEPPPTRTGVELMQVPDTPTHLVPNPQTLAPPMVAEAVRQWQEQTRPARVVADPVLGLPLPSWS